MKTDVLFAAALTLLAARDVGAEGGWRSDKDVARDIAHRGAEYFDDGDWERAREHFHRAYEIVPAPTLALMEARALVKLGRLAEATDAYSKAASAAPEEGNEPYKRASSTARVELAVLVTKVPSIRVLFPATGPRPSVRVDGAPVIGSTSMPVNPGTHVITISVPGVPESWQTVTLAEGEQRAIPLDLPPPNADRSKGSRPLSPLMWTAFGVGGAGIVAGVVTGAFALSRKSKLDDACNGATCPPGYEDDVRDYHRLRDVSIASYLVGVAGLAGGAVIFATSPKPSGDTTKLRASVSSGGPALVFEGAF
jgi:hypothetical protein